MRLGWIELTDFRSYRSITFQPSGEVNVLVGPNGAGKTNLLEALAYLATLKSLRRAPEAALVRLGTGQAILRGAVTGADTETLVEIEIPAEGRRRVQVNRQRLARSSDVLGYVRMVAFLPDDLDIVKRSPSYRRDFVDEVSIQMWPGAYLDLGDFERALRQRNTLLRQMGRAADQTTLSVWNERLSHAGARVVARRAAALRALAPLVGEAYEALAGSTVAIDVEYHSEWGGVIDPGVATEEQAARLWAALERSERQDKERRTTTTGPHRDEPRFSIDGRPSRTHASQGEQRTLVLALRLATHRAIAATIDAEPILILDDVFSELDMARAGALAAALPPAQTFVTTARQEEVPITGRRWAVSGGVIS